MRRLWSRRLAVAGSVSVLALAPVTALSGCEEQPPPGPSGGTVTLSFGVFGPAPVVAGYQTMVDDWNATAQSVEVELRSWPTREEMTDELAGGAAPPDVYLLSRRDLDAVLETGRNVPLFELLEARDVSYGDDFAQPAIEAFSADDDLQCMPSTISPMVVYYNTDLVDFDAMRERDLPAPAPDAVLDGWTFEEFEAAATFASRRGNRGVSISPSVESLAPFLLSGGGSAYDDATDPTSLTFGSNDNFETLTTLLDVLRDPTLTLSEEQLAEATPLEWFERGRLGMIEGFRDLTPRLREVEGLDFDVISLPRLGGPATVGDVTGLCIAPGDHVEQAADFLVHAIADESVVPLAESGYVVPANVGVARAPAFLQPGAQPEHAGVFNASVDALRLLPEVDDPAALDAAVGPLLEQLLTSPGVIDVEEVTAEIDEASRSVLDPDYTPSPAEPSSS